VTWSLKKKCLPAYILTDIPQMAPKFGRDHNRQDRIEKPANRILARVAVVSVDGPAMVARFERLPITVQPFPETAMDCRHCHVARQDRCRQCYLAVGANLPLWDYGPARASADISGQGRLDSTDLQAMKKASQ
jgi:hypothetical protein